MKIKLLLLAGLAAVLALSGCATNPTSANGGSSIFTTLAPAIAEAAQARIAYRMLDRHPNREASLLAIATALDTISADAEGTEISEVVIRAFVARETAQWGLIAAEQELLVQGFLATLGAAKSGAGVPIIRIGDTIASTWIDAVRRGIRAGVESHRLARS